MYGPHWAQDVLRCHLCETPAPPLYCDICHIHLCKVCAGEHLLDESKEHKVLPFKKRGLNPKCSKHSTQFCDIHCEQCDIPICVECISSREHIGHVQISILKILENKKEALKKDLQELENTIYPQYQEMASNISGQKDDIIKNSKELKTAISKHGEDLHREIDTAIEIYISHVDIMESNEADILNELEKELKQSMYEINQVMANLNELLNANVISLVSDYKSRNAEFKKLPPKYTVSLPEFTPRKIEKELVYQQIGSFSAISSKSKEHGYIKDFPYSLNRPLIDDPRIINDITTAYGGFKELYSVSCLSGDEVWIRGWDNIMRLYNSNGKLVKSIQTKSGNMPWDITVTNSGELVYTDNIQRTVNIVKNTNIQTVIRLQGWYPLYVCNTPTGDLLVVMYSDTDSKQTKIVRYSGSIEKQTIQFNNKGQPLYSSNNYSKYICVNKKNMDICVADHFAHAVVVVNKTGRLRFTYTGRPTTSSTNELFTPVGITTDSQGLIMLSDIDNHCIHVLYQNGKFLRYIENCNLKRPWGLCVDTRDNLFIAEHNKGTVKKIQYYIY